MAETTISGMLITDFDGTLRPPHGTFHEADLQALATLGNLGVVRVIATGRSLFSFQRAQTATLPVDYVIFSSGAGIMRHPSGNLLRKVDLSGEQVRLATAVLRHYQVSFMIHRPVPESHFFHYVVGKEPNPDFERRLGLYRQYASPLDGDGSDFGPATQLLAIFPPGENPDILESIRRELPQLNVIRTTSPLDGCSLWVEIFPPGVSKSAAASWLAARLGIEAASVLVVGNDFNDWDLLEWGGTSFVVSDAPLDLQRNFDTVAAVEQGAVAEAVNRWLRQMQPR